MGLDFEIKHDEKKIIKEQTKGTLIIGYWILFSIIIQFLLAYYLKIDMETEKKVLDMMYKIFNILAIFIVIVVLGLKKSLYFSPKIIKKDDDLLQILQKWRSLDIIFLALGESISIIGLLITLMGIPFNRTFHFFIVSSLVILMVLPVSWRVEGKLNIFYKHFQKM